MNLFKMPKLNFSVKSLEPLISEQTINIHYGKHHQTYLNNLNKLIDENSKYENMSIEDIIIESHKCDDTPVFNNAAQFYNHNIYWLSIAPENEVEKPSSKLQSMIEEEFESMEAFEEKLASLCVSQFGSGWAWLSLDKDGKLKLSKSSNADNPIIKGETPLLTIDVWEHAYYLDYQNRRPDYVKNLMLKLINYSHANELIEKI